MYSSIKTTIKTVSWPVGCHTRTGGFKPIIHICIKLYTCMLRVYVCMHPIAHKVHVKNFSFLIDAIEL